jgi:LruC domain-containing protein
MAAAIRLIGYNYDDIESVTIEEGRTFDGSFDQRRVFIEDADLLLRGRNNEAVINLFEDAHYALSPRLNSQDRGGGTVRMFYNTSRNPDGTNSLQIAPKSLTYVIKFRNPRILQNFTLETLDPFAMEDFNSGKWEVHLGPYKEAQVMYDLGDNETASINRMVWALKIPSGDFKYPIEKQSLGLYKNGVLTGAYMMMDHSYGQWIADHTSSIDWFLYPTVGLVY